MQPTPSPSVIIRHCDSYDPERIRSIVREGLEALGLRPHGRALVKPNLVASGPLFEHAHTRAEFVEGVLMALKDRADQRLLELAVGERCGITVPTRAAFAGAGYDAMLRRQRVTRYCFEEEPQVEIPLRHAGRLRDYIFTPEPVARADFFVNCPKFKAHPWTTVTFSMKNYIGIQDDRHRLIDHDHRLNEKIADLQYVVQPQFIAIDAIIGGEGRMLTPVPFALNLIIMGDNQVAFDAVCSRIVGLDPMDIEHIRLAHQRGFGPVAMERITISGDVALEEARERGKGFKAGLVRVDRYFDGTHVRAYAGPPPEREAADYCWGGCPGAIQEAIEILRRFDRACDEKMPRLHVVFGAYRGPIDAKPGEKVIFIGDCASWEGRLGGDHPHGNPVSVPSVYRDRSTRDPHRATHEDIYAKMVKTVAKLRAHADAPVIRFEGCPVSVAEHVLLLGRLGGLKNPYFNLSRALTFNKAYLMWRGRAALHRAMGVPYQRKGPTSRGAAQPRMGRPDGGQRDPLVAEVEPPS